MFAPPGFTALSTLWQAFHDRCAHELYGTACRYYQSQDFLGESTFGTRREYGSPLGYIGNVFIATLAEQDLMLCALSGQTMHVEARVQDGSSDWFQKL